MEIDKNIARNLFEKYIKGTMEKVMVEEVNVFLCFLTFAVAKENQFGQRIYLNTRVLKHIYDKKPAEEFDCIILFLHRIVRYPDHIYKNKNPKRGDYIFVKKIEEKIYLCSLEKNSRDGFNVVTAFRLRKENYLKSYDSLWSWRGGGSSS